MPRLTIQQRRVAKLARRHGIISLTCTDLRGREWAIHQLLTGLSKQDLTELEERLKTFEELQASLRCLN